jgi:uncharacterized protein with PQ loop repeat
MSSVLMPVLLVVANVFGAGMIVPQVVRFRRHRVADGVSGAWIGVGLAVNAWWVAYALQGRLWGLLPVSAVSWVLYGVMAGQYSALIGRPALRQLLAGVAGFGAAPFVGLLWGGWPGAGLAIGLLYAVQFSPAALSALRAVDVSGISPVTWSMAWVEAAIWFLYGLTESDVALVVGGLGGALMAGIVLTRVRIGPRPAARPGLVPD